MSKYLSSDFKLGIICGGQLGKMLGLAAANWDVSTHVLDANEDCPAAKVCNEYTKGHHTDFDAVYAFGKNVDLITFEIEHVNIEALKKLKAEGKAIFPDPELLETIKDKGLQKLFYQKHNIPSSNFELYEHADQILTAIKEGKLQYPFVQKSRTDGYDGKGVAVIQSEKDLELILQVPSVVEDAVAIEKEIAISIARNQKGEMALYPLVEMEFSETANLVEFLSCPANVSESIEKEAVSLAIKIAESLDLVGILAVELFLDKQGNLSVNECAPRTHNSGHHTIENNYTSQFEQQIRAVLNLPLGSTKMKSPAVMINLLGEDNYSGPVYYEGFEEIMQMEGVHPHIYGKSTTKPFRKMGHITIVDDSLENAIEKAREVKEKIKVISR